MRALVLAAVAVVGCSSESTSTANTSQFDPLFASPPANATATPTSVMGLWGGKDKNDDGETFDSRWLFESGKLTHAIRCVDRSGEHVTVGVAIAARIELDSFEALESASDTKKTSAGVACSTGARPGRTAFKLEGTSLTMGRDAWGSSYASLVKLRD